MSLLGVLLFRFIVDLTTVSVAALLLPAPGVSATITPLVRRVLTFGGHRCELRAWEQRQADVHQKVASNTLKAMC